MKSQDNQLLCLWAGILFLLGYGIGWWPIAQFLPPPDPAMGADGIARLMTDGGIRIRVGMFIGIAASALYVPWSVAIFSQMSRIEKGRVPVLSYVQLLSGIMNVPLFLFPSGLWVVAAFSANFRASISAELLQLVNDTAWILFLVMFSPAALQAVALAVVGLQDNSERPTMPRWFSFFNLWCAFLFAPAGIVSFFISGPFAWNGLFGLWVPVFTFTLWILVVFVVVRNSILKETLTVN